MSKPNENLCIIDGYKIPIPPKYPRGPVCDVLLFKSFFQDLNFNDKIAAKRNEAEEIKIIKSTKKIKKYAIIKNYRESISDEELLQSIDFDFFYDINSLEAILRKYGANTISPIAAIIVLYCAISFIIKYNDYSFKNVDWLIVGLTKSLYFDELIKPSSYIFEILVDIIVNNCNEITKKMIENIMEHIKLNTSLSKKFSNTFLSLCKRVFEKSSEQDNISINDFLTFITVTLQKNCAFLVNQEGLIELLINYKLLDFSDYKNFNLRVLTIISSLSNIGNSLYFKDLYSEHLFKIIEKKINEEKSLIKLELPEKKLKIKNIDDKIPMFDIVENTNMKKIIIDYQLNNFLDKLSPQFNGFINLIVKFLEHSNEKNVSQFIANFSNSFNNIEVDLNAYVLLVALFVKIVIPKTIDLSYSIESFIEFTEKRNPFLIEKLFKNSLLPYYKDENYNFLASFRKTIINILSIEKDYLIKLFQSSNILMNVEFISYLNMNSSYFENEIDDEILQFVFDLSDKLQYINYHNQFQDQKILLITRNIVFDFLLNSVKSSIINSEKYTYRFFNYLFEVDIQNLFFLQIEKYFVLTQKHCKYSLFINFMIKSLSKCIQNINNNYYFNLSNLLIRLIIKCITNDLNLIKCFHPLFNFIYDTVISRPSNEGMKLLLQLITVNTKNEPKFLPPSNILNFIVSFIKNSDNIDYYYKIIKALVTGSSYIPKKKLFNEFYFIYNPQYLILQFAAFGNSNFFNNYIEELYKNSKISFFNLNQCHEGNIDKLLILFLNKGKEKSIINYFGLNIEMHLSKEQQDKIVIPFICLLSSHNSSYSFASQLLDLSFSNKKMLKLLENLIRYETSRNNETIISNFSNGILLKNIRGSKLNNDIKIVLNFYLDTQLLTKNQQTLQILNICDSQNTQFLFYIDDNTVYVKYQDDNQSSLGSFVSLFNKANSQEELFINSQTCFTLSIYLFHYSDKTIIIAFKNNVHLGKLIFIPFNFRDEELKCNCFSIISKRKVNNQQDYGIIKNIDLYEIHETSGNLKENNVPDIALFEKFDKKINFEIVKNDNIVNYESPKPLISYFGFYKLFNKFSKLIGKENSISLLITTKYLFCYFNIDKIKLYLKLLESSVRKFKIDYQLYLALYDIFNFVHENSVKEQFIELFLLNSKLFEKADEVELKYILLHLKTEVIFSIKHIIRKFQKNYARHFLELLKNRSEIQNNQIIQNSIIEIVWTIYSTNFKESDSNYLFKYLNDSFGTSLFEFCMLLLNKLSPFIQKNYQQKFVKVLTDYYNKLNDSDNSIAIKVKILSTINEILGSNFITNILLLFFNINKQGIVRLNSNQKSTKLLIRKLISEIENYHEFAALAFILCLSFEYENEFIQETFKSISSIHFKIPLKQLFSILILMIIIGFKIRNNEIFNDISQFIYNHIDLKNLENDLLLILFFIDLLSILTKLNCDNIKYIILEYLYKNLSKDLETLTQLLNLTIFSYFWKIKTNGKINKINQVTSILGFYTFIKEVNSFMDKQPVLTHSEENEQLKKLLLDISKEKALSDYYLSSIFSKGIVPFNNIRSKDHQILYNIQKKYSNMSSMTNSFIFVLKPLILSYSRNDNNFIKRKETKIVKKFSGQFILYGFNFENTICYIDNKGNIMFSTINIGGEIVNEVLKSYKINNLNNNFYFFHIDGFFICYDRNTNKLLRYSIQSYDEIPFYNETNIFSSYGNDILYCENHCIIKSVEKKKILFKSDIEIQNFTVSNFAKKLVTSDYENGIEIHDLEKNKSIKCNFDCLVKNIMITNYQHFIIVDTIKKLYILSNDGKIIESLDIKSPIVKWESITNSSKTDIIILLTQNFDIYLLNPNKPKELKVIKNEEFYYLIPISVGYSCKFIYILTSEGKIEFIENNLD